MTPINKQSKKAQREFYKSKRNTWTINPITRKGKGSHEYKQAKERMRGME